MGRFAMAANTLNNETRSQFQFKMGIWAVSIIFIVTAAGQCLCVSQAWGKGLSRGGNQIWHQDVGIFGKAEEDDAFGKAVASGDFNGDGYDDLAVGAIDEDIGEISSAGAVNVIYGTAEGLAAFGNQIWYQNISGIQDASEAYDHFGESIASGDFNGDGYDDLAVGVSSEDIGEISGGGAVNIIYGTAEGLAASGNQMWHQNSTGILGGAEHSDYFGAAVASGDFNGDAYDDLAVGVSSESIGEIFRAGAVNVIYGASEGLAASGNQMWHQDSPGILGGAETNDVFGESLASGDFDGDGYDDLAVGAKGEYIGDIPDAGMVNVIYGTSEGLASSGNQIWHQDITDIAGEAQGYDHFGNSVAAGNFNGDRSSDLAVGAYTDKLPSGIHAGAVNVFYSVPDPVTPPAIILFLLNKDQ
jgi:hypothetical protein